MTPGSPVEALIAKWRERAEPCRHSKYYDASEAETNNTCADELSAALAREEKPLPMPADLEAARRSLLKWRPTFYDRGENGKDTTTNYLSCPLCGKYNYEAHEDGCDLDEARRCFEQLQKAEAALARREGPEDMNSPASSRGPFKGADQNRLVLADAVTGDAEERAGSGQRGSCDTPVQHSNHKPQPKARGDAALRSAGSPDAHPDEARQKDKGPLPKSPDAGDYLPGPPGGRDGQAPQDTKDDQARVDGVPHDFERLTRHGISGIDDAK